MIFRLNIWKKRKENLLDTRGRFNPKELCKILRFKSSWWAQKLEQASFTAQKSFNMEADHYVISKARVLQ